MTVLIMELLDEASCERPTTVLPCWTFPMLVELLESTVNIARGLAKLGLPSGERLSQALPESFSATTLSAALKDINTAGIIRLLAEIEQDLVNASAKCRLGSKMRLFCREARRFWNNLLQADLSQELDTFETTVSISGPKPRIEQIRAAVVRAIDDAIIRALKDLRLGIDPKTGRLVILDDVGLGYVYDVSLTGDALKERVEELGGTLAPEEEVVEYLSKLFSEDDDDELDEEDFKAGGPPV